MTSQNPILDRLSQLCPDDSADPDGNPSHRQPAFAAQGRIAADEFSLRVQGIGALGRPLTADDAALVHRASHPARFGYRELTLFDPSIRDTGEIAADSLELSWPDEDRADLLREICASLGAPPLEARLHSLLVYGPGEFFKPHQDTEKHPGMIGTLVLVWPSAHIGGDLKVRHGSSKMRFASQQLHGGEIRWCAFFADCRHEVLPVEEGWRVALTFDLVAAPNVTTARADQMPDLRLQAALRAQFGLDATASLDPWALLLDHEYTEHGLRWHLLKGTDKARVTALRAAAQGLGLSVHLALAEVHESWSAIPEERSRRGRGTDSNPVPGELIDLSITLDFWVDSDGQVGPRGPLSILEKNTACFVETDDEYLVDEEYEGYMGNYGETLDYWYRRAALVIQSRATTERNRFKVDFAAALKDLRAMALDPSQAPALSERVALVLDLLTQRVRNQGRVLVASYAEVAAALSEDGAATALIGEFDPADFIAEDAKVLATLQQRRGTAWMQALWRQWLQRLVRPGAPGIRYHREESPAHPTHRLALWPTPLPDFVRIGLAAGLSTEVLDDALGTFALAALVCADSERARYSPSRRLGLQVPLRDAACELVTALRLLPQPAQPVRQLLTHLAERPTLYPPVELAVLVTAAGSHASTEPAKTPLRPLVVQALKTALAQPERRPDDHSMFGIDWCCSCADCQPVRRWAESATPEPLVLSMAESRRVHIIDQLRTAAAPVSAQTLKVGSPYKLRLHKPSDLHARDRARRARWLDELRGLG